MSTTEIPTIRELRNLMVTEFHDFASQGSIKTKKQHQVCSLKLAHKVTLIIVRGLGLQMSEQSENLPEVKFPEEERRDDEFFIQWANLIVKDEGFRRNIEGNLHDGITSNEPKVKAVLDRFIKADEQKKNWNSFSRRNSTISSTQKTNKDYFYALKDLVEVQKHFIKNTFSDRLNVKHFSWLMGGINLDTVERFIRDTDNFHFPDVLRMMYYLSSVGIKYELHEAYLNISTERIHRNSSLDDKILHLDWICYEPRGYCPYSDTLPDTVQIKNELKFLRLYFSGIITFGCGGSLSEIPRLAKEEGFEGIILGIENPDNEDLLDVALQLKGQVDGFCIGHNFEIDKLKNWTNSKKLLLKQIEKLQNSSGKPVTTTYYYASYDREFMEIVDFICPDIGGTWRLSKGDYSRQMDYMLAEFGKYVDKATSDACEWKKPVLLKMISCPSGGVAPFSEDFQATYFRSIRNEQLGKTSISFPKTKVGISFFSAWDIPWKEPGGPGLIDWTVQEKFTGIFHGSDSLKKAGGEFRDRN